MTLSQHGFNTLSAPAPSGNLLWIHYMHYKMHRKRINLTRKNSNPYTKLWDIYTNSFKHSFQLVHNIHITPNIPSGQMTSNWRRTDIDTTWWRRIDDSATSPRRHVPAGYAHSTSLTLNQRIFITDSAPFAKWEYIVDTIQALYKVQELLLDL